MLAHVGALFRIGTEGLLSTLFPAECRLCDEPLLSVSRLPVCESCLSGIQSFQFNTCSRCGEAVPSPAIDQCTACRNAPPPFVTAKAIGPYDGKLRGLVHLLKYQGVRPAGATLAKRMAGELAKHRADLERPVIVAIPLHRNKFRARGFNQAEEIATALKKITGYEMNSFVLQRRRDTSSQTGMTAHQRRENVRAAFVVRPKHKREVAGRNIVLVDDVMTTGATAAECSRILLRAGARQIFVLTAARVTSQAVVNQLAAEAGAQG
jgi:ComF family protein